VIAVRHFYGAAVIETGNDSYHFRQSSTTAKSRIKAREQAKRTNKTIPSNDET